MKLIEKDCEYEILEEIADSDREDGELTKDWSGLSKLSKISNHPIIPKRGEKDYEPDGTNVQERLLYDARKDMFDSLYNSLRGTVIKHSLKAYYDSVKHMGVVINPKGNFLNTMGVVDQTDRCWLEFHEFVYLAERGTITPYIQVSNHMNDPDLDIPLSIQDLYSFFKSQKEMEEFFIFSHLKRSGFIIISANLERSEKTSFFPEEQDLKKMVLFQSVNKILTSLCGLSFSLFNISIYHPLHFFFHKYRSSSQIYKSLNTLIPFYKAPSTISMLMEERIKSQKSKIKVEERWKIAFNMWKPRSIFKKKSPGLPDFQIVIYNKNDKSQHFPTYSEIREIFQRLDYRFEFLQEINNDSDWDEHTYINGAKKKPSVSKIKHTPQDIQTNTSHNSYQKKQTTPGNYPSHVHQFKRLKRGYRSFILAVMDDGLISFIKISEADFGSENIWYESKTKSKVYKSKKNTNKTSR